MTSQPFLCSVLLVGTLSLSSIASLSNTGTQKPRPRQTQPRRPSETKPLTNADVVKMVKNNFSEDSIITTIQNNKTQFDLSVDALIALKNAGVGERLISVMQSAQASGRVSPAPPAGTPEISTPVPPVSITSASSLQQPYVLVVYGGTKQPLPLEPTHVGKAEAKGNDLGELAKEQATDKLYNAIQLSAATRLGVAIDSRLVRIPILGAGAGAAGAMSEGISKAARIVHKPKPVMYLWAVPGHNSSLGLRTTMPQFEAVYGDIPGTDPEEYEPFVVRLAQTRENWRLVGAKKDDPEAYRSKKWSAYTDFMEERTPTRSNRLGRGRFLITLERPLEAGEYGVVLRPVLKTKIFAGEDIANRERSGILFDTAWTFSIAP
jgi:hypothetical protein